MSAEVIEIGRYVKIPYDVVISKLSNRAFRVWSLIAAEASPDDQVALLRQSTLAQKLGCSTYTIGRAIAELVKQGLLREDAKWNKGRCKSYRLKWNPSLKVDEKIPVENAVSKTPLDEVLLAHGTNWAQEYPCFDGEGDRPSLSECVGEALSNATKAKGDDLKAFIDMWLQIASQRWSASKAPPPVVEEVAKVSVARAESSDEHAWIIAQISADNERQRRKEALEAKRKASLLSRAAALANSTSDAVRNAVIDKPICPENYPFSWEFYKIQWAELPRNKAA